MTTQSVALPVETYHQSLIYLMCADCGQSHYFRSMPFQEGSHVRYNHPKAPEPTTFQTECPSCLAIQENDQEAVKAAFDHTANDPKHAQEMTQVPEFTKVELPNHVLACPRCSETVLFNTDWKGNITTFWSFGHDRMTNLSITDFAEWKRLMAGDPDCGFCEKLHASETDAITEAEDYTNTYFPNLNDDPPRL